MKTKTCFSLPFTICLAVASVAIAQPPSVVWQKTIGGSNTDSLAAMSIGANNTFVLCGSSKSNKSGSKSDKNFGGFDYWVVKMDFSGNVIWNKTFGGKKDDIASAIIATSDGGFLVGGTSISDKSAGKSAASFKKSKDYWVIKLDANGNKIWDKTLGGFFTDKLTSLIELPSGRFMAGGYSFSNDNGNKTIKNLGSENNADYWTLMLDKNGNIISQSSFGGGSMDVLACLSPAGANNMYVAGYSYSIKYPGRKSLLPVGNNDFWIVKSDMNGTIQQETGFGGNRSDYLTCMQTLHDNSLIIGGYSNSPASGNKSGNFVGVTDYWLVKTKADGTKLWDKTFGGTAGDYLMWVQQTKDKGFILGGYSNSNQGYDKTQNSKGGYDYWLVKLDSSGNKKWDKTIGGSGDDKISAVYEIDTNQFIVAGTSNSAVSGDKTNGTTGNSGASDFWILRLSAGSAADKNVSQPIAAFSSVDKAVGFEITPNPVRNTLTIRYFMAENSKANFVVYASNGNAVLKAILFSAGSRSFDISRLGKGIYYAVIYEGDNKITKMFVKE